MSDSFVTPWIIAPKGPLFMGFPRQEYRSRLHFLLQGIFLTQGWNLCLLHSAFFVVQLSPTWLLEKTIALTIRTFVGKVMSLLFNMLSRFVKTFLPRSKCFFNFMATLTICSDFGVQENKICHCFIFSQCICHVEIGPDAMILSFLNVEF